MIPTLAITAYMLVGVVFIAALFTYEGEGEELHPGMFVAAVALWPVFAVMALANVAREWFAGRSED